MIPKSPNVRLTGRRYFRNKYLEWIYFGRIDFLEFGIFAHYYELDQAVLIRNWLVE